MTGITGTSQTKKTYNYYFCVGSKRKECNKKSIPKDLIENIVINETRKMLTNDRIKIIAREVVRLCKNESNTPTLQRLRKRIKEIDIAIENLIKALESGQASDIMLERITEKRKKNFRKRGITRIN